MKVIGKANDKLLIEMTLSEYRDITATPFKRNNMDREVYPSAGTEIDVRKSWESINDCIANEKRVLRAADDLEDFANNLRSLLRIVPQLDRESDQ